MYILETAVYWRFKCSHVQGSDLHNYGKRSRDNYRVTHYRLQIHSALPSLMGICEKNFKILLGGLLVEGALYTVGEFMGAAHV